MPLSSSSWQRPPDISGFPITNIKSIDWTNITILATVGVMHAMDNTDQSQELETEPSAHECECPEPCNCDHENE